MSGAQKPSSDRHESLRGLGSALICAHLFCVALALSANWSRSPLQDRWLNAPGLRHYLRWLHFDSPFVAGFHLTQAMEYEDDHRLFVEWPEGKVIARYPEESIWRGGFRAERRRTYLGRFASFAQENEGEAISELFRTVAQREMAQQPDLKANSAQPMVIRFIRMHPPELEPESPSEPMPVDVFIADVWRDESGEMRVNKRVATGEAAQVER